MDPGLFAIRIDRWGDRALRRRSAKVDGSLLRCYACGGTAAVTAKDPVDPVVDRGQWLTLECPLTPGCPGQLVPEALN